MIRHSSIRRVTSAATAVASLALGAAVLGAQGNPPPVSVPPAGSLKAPPQAAVSPFARVPGDSDVALCNDGTWVKAPRLATDCAARGGLTVAMPQRPKRPAPAIPAAAIRAPTASAASAAMATAEPPAGATMRCKDGTYLGGTPSTSSCSANGGVAALIPVPKAEPVAPPRRP